MIPVNETERPRSRNNKCLFTFLFLTSASPSTSYLSPKILKFSDCHSVCKSKDLTKPRLLSARETVFDAKNAGTSNSPVEPFLPRMIDKTLEEASNFLLEWDRRYNEAQPWMHSISFEANESHPRLLHAVQFLNQIAADERMATNGEFGRCILGICASNSSDGISTLKQWVSSLNLPRGLLHGMDVQGVPIDLPGAVYIKYNTGGCYTFTQIRQSKIGFESLWKPGDAYIEGYDGQYRGVYFQVELSDQNFRQYMLPIDLFCDQQRQGYDNLSLESKAQLIQRNDDSGKHVIRN
jgi:hypothetical protein